MPPAPAPESPEALSVAFAHYAAEQAAALCVEPDHAESAHRPSLVLSEVEGSIACPERSRRVWPQNDSARSASAGLLPQPLVRLWNDVLATMQTRITRHEFNAWIRPATLQSVDQGIAIIRAPNARIKDGLEQRYITPLSDLLTALLGASIHVHVTVQVEAEGTDQYTGSVGGAAPAVVLAQSPAAQARSGAEEAAASTEVPVAVSAPSAPPAPAPDHRPDWISAGQWTALPAMLRAALIGSTVADGVVQAISPHLTSLLETRYAREVAVLIAAVERAPCYPNIIMSL
jgi:DnaA-like protein